MNLLKQAQEQVGSGFRGSGKQTGLFSPANQKALLSSEDIAPKVTLTYVEPAFFNVTLEGGEQARPATLKCGELIPYSVEEMAEMQETEFAHGKCVHFYRGYVRNSAATVREGAGSLHYGGGEVFEGRWKHNNRSGLGCLYLPTGYALEANFKEDRACGKGREIFPKGDMYVGEFANDKPNGKGVLYYMENGSRYEGGWENGEKHGYGAMFYQNGDVFQGLWVRGKREGDGLTTYHATGKSYRSAWKDDICEMKMKYVPPESVPEVRSEAVPYEVVSPLLGTDLRLMKISSDLWTEIHPVAFQRIKTAFESLDAACCGEIEMDYLKSVWDPNNMDTLERLEKSATTVGADDTLELIEVLTGLYQHLPGQECKRWVAVDILPESLLRLRGVLCGVQSTRYDGFYTLTGGKSEITLEQVQSSRGVVGSMKISRAMFLRAKILYQKETMTFQELLTQIFPNVWPDVIYRCELETVPQQALQAYSAAFDAIDETLTGYFSLEKMKSAQKKYQMALSVGQAMNPANAYERLLDPGFFKHQPRWMIGDISFTVPLFKTIDKGKTGYLSLLEILRFAFPNVPCMSTKERFGSNIRADDFCRCVLCNYCSHRYTKARPLNPYLDGVIAY